MSEELKKLNSGELEEVSGGKHNHKAQDVSSLADCPPGTIEIKNETLRNYHEKKKKCKGDNCDSKDLRTVNFYMVDTGKLVEGQICNKCGARWLTC